VASIIDESTFLILDGLKLYSDILERDLETVLPASKEYKEAFVMILHGEFKGEQAHILEKNKKTEMVTVQMTDSAGLQILTLHMDHVCLYKQPNN
jgi:transcription antitermination factor NusG